MTIRLAEPADLEAVRGITRRAYARYVPELGAKPLPLVTDYAPKITAGEVWLLEKTGTPAALIVLEENGDHIHIFSIAVDPDAQSQGIGQRLLSFAEDRARKTGRDLLTLVTNARMERNIGIYERAGYVETARHPHPVRPGWVLVHMEKRLSSGALSRRSA
jgi:ribosomal protein S18 acetylase RimI-like enzyme